MRYKTLALFVLFSIMASCRSSRKVSMSKKRHYSYRKKTRPSNSKSVTLADKVVWTAVTYKGVPYKYGGTTTKGMDCSGLIHTSFKARKVALPRTSRQMFALGHDITLGEVRRGDLLFFKTIKNSDGINHVGLVTAVKKNDIKFIHATSSKGVIISSLKQYYWKKTFFAAKRVLWN